MRPRASSSFPRLLSLRSDKTFFYAAVPCKNGCLLMEMSKVKAQRTPVSSGGKQLLDTEVSSRNHPALSISFTRLPLNTAISESSLGKMQYPHASLSGLSEIVACR